MATKSTSPTVTQSAKTLGSLGGIKGGPARAASLTPTQRSDIASKGGVAKAAKAGK